MNILDLLKPSKTVPSSEIERLIKELTALKSEMVNYANEAEIDIEIAEMIGSLKARDSDKITGKELVEFLVYLSDKTKTKTDETRNHFNDTMMKVIHAKIELLLIYHKNLIQGSVLRQIFSMSTVWPVIAIVTFVAVALVTIHKYDPGLFSDLGISHKVSRESK
jgi:hypothetical protein